MPQKRVRNGVTYWVARYRRPDGSEAPQKIFPTRGNNGTVGAWLAAGAPVIAVAAGGVGLIFFRRHRGVRA